MKQEELDIQMAKAQEVKEANEEKILALPNVLGVGIGYKEIGGSGSLATLNFKSPDSIYIPYVRFDFS